MASKYMKRCSASLIIREMQIKTVMKYLFTSIRMAIIKTTTTKTANHKCWQGCGEIGTLVHCWWKCIQCSPCGKQYVASSKN